jgi:hypothetical protein
MGLGNLHGWHADPFGRHERRFFSAGRPTKLVRDGDDESYDELPAERSPLAAGSPEPPDSADKAAGAAHPG